MYEQPSLITKQCENLLLSKNEPFFLKWHKYIVNCRVQIDLLSLEKKISAKLEVDLFGRANIKTSTTE